MVQCDETERDDQTRLGPKDRARLGAGHRAPGTSTPRPGRRGEQQRAGRVKQKIKVVTIIITIIIIIVIIVRIHLRAATSQKWY